MTSFISHLHTDLRQVRLTKRGSTHDAKDVPQGLHKEYPRMEHIVLPAPSPLDAGISEILERRFSYHKGNENTELSVTDCGTLLGTALKRRSLSNSRNYPSGGALYPIETYLFSIGLEGQPPAVFHYNPTEHVLEKLWDLPDNFLIKDLAHSPDDLLFSSMLVFTSVWKRSSAKYGDFTYTLALLEAGHMSENILLVSTALNLHARPMAGFNDDLILRILDLDPEEEQPVHSITLSKNSS